MATQKSKKKCNCCGKAMTDAEYINYLENELAKVQQELALVKCPPVNIPWTKPHWEWPYTTATWSTLPAGTGVLGHEMHMGT